MLAKRVPTILPDLTFEEALEVTKVYSVSGLISKEATMITERPYRAPHHTITSMSLIGGGKNPKPGEISLAHYGVLFLDELAEFNKYTLELLREPIEDGKVVISRVNATTEYPCKFMLIASLNPCPCGYYGSKNKECKCTKKEIEKYMSRISGPLIDRIDIQIEVSPVEYNKLNSEEQVESSKEIKIRINQARKKQIERYKENNIYSNSEITSDLIKKYCKLNNSSKKILENAFNKLGLSARGYERIIKVARTIADLDEKDEIEEKHVAEAIQYRSLDRKYFRN